MYFKFTYYDGESVFNTNNGKTLSFGHEKTQRK